MPPSPKKQELGRKGRFSMPKRTQTCIQIIQIGAKREANTSQGTFKDTLAEQGRKNYPKRVLTNAKLSSPKNRQSDFHGPPQFSKCYVLPK